MDFNWKVDNKGNWSSDIFFIHIEVNRCWNVSKNSPLTYTVWINGNTVLPKEFTDVDEAKQKALNYIFHK